MLHDTRSELTQENDQYPKPLLNVSKPPQKLYVIGEVSALCEGLAVVGARKATPYGISCARRFATLAAKRGIVILSGGARGCDAQAHEAALAANAPTVVFLGGGCDEVYPPEHCGLFQRVIDAGGAVVSEHAWDFKPKPWAFRMRNRLIAGLARAVLIVEAGLPSGTFSTADEALAASREVLVVPGAITSSSSRGANRLLYQGATPIVDDDSFEDVLFSLFGCLKTPPCDLALGDTCNENAALKVIDNPIVRALRAEPLSMDSLYVLASEHCGKSDPRTWLMERLVEAECAGCVSRYPDGRWGSKG